MENRKKKYKIINLKLFDWLFLSQIIFFFKKFKADYTEINDILRNRFRNIKKHFQIYIKFVYL